MNLVRNLIYRQNGIMYKGDKRIYDTNGLVHRLNSSIYNVERMCKLHELDAHDGCVNCLNFNKTGNLIVTGSDDLKVIVWDWAKSKPIVTVHATGHRSNVFQTKFLYNGSADNQTDFSLITSARDGEVRLIRVGKDGHATPRLIANHSCFPVHRIAISDTNPNEVLTAGEDGSVIRTDLRDSNTANEKIVKLRVNGRGTGLYSIAVHPLDPEFCICGRDKYVRVYDKRNVKVCSKMFCPENILKQTVINVF